MAEQKKKRALARRTHRAATNGGAQEGGSKVTSNPLKLLVTVVNRNKAEYYADLLQSFEVNLQLTVSAEGTADASMLELLGLTDSRKSVIFSVIQQNRLPDALYALENRFSAVRDGKGIAFAIPLSSVMGALLYGFLSNNKSMVRTEN